MHLAFPLVLLHIVHRKNFSPTAQLSEVLGSLPWATSNSRVVWLSSGSLMAPVTELSSWQDWPCKGRKKLIWVPSRNSSPCFQQSDMASLPQTNPYSSVFHSHEHYHLKLFLEQWKILIISRLFPLVERKRSFICSSGTACATAETADWTSSSRATPCHCALGLNRSYSLCSSFLYLFFSGLWIPVMPLTTLLLGNNNKVACPLNWAWLVQLHSILPWSWGLAGIRGFRLFDRAYTDILQYITFLPWIKKSISCLNRVQIRSRYKVEGSLPSVRLCQAI